MPMGRFFITSYTASLVTELIYFWKFRARIVLVLIYLNSYSRCEFKFLYALLSPDLNHISSMIGLKQRTTVNFVLARYLTYFLGSSFVYILSGYISLKAEISSVSSTFDENDIVPIFLGPLFTYVVFLRFKLNSSYSAASLICILSSSVGSSKDIGYAECKASLFRLFYLPGGGDFSSCTSSISYSSEP